MLTCRLSHSARALFRGTLAVLRSSSHLRTSGLHPMDFWLFNSFATAVRKWGTVELAHAAEYHTGARRRCRHHGILHGGVSAVGG